MYRGMGYAGKTIASRVDKKLQKYAGGLYVKFQFDGTAYYAPMWKHKTIADLERACINALTRPKTSSEKKCDCKKQEQYSDIIGHIEIEVLKTDLVQSFLEAAHKFTDNCLLTHYLIDVCKNVLRHPNHQQWGTVTKLFCTSILYRVGKTTFSELLRGRGNEKEDNEVNLSNFNLLLPCVKTIQSCVPQFEWKKGCTEKDVQQLLNVLKRHPNGSSVITVLQTDATELIKRLCLGKDKMVYGHVNGALSPQEFLQEESNGDFSLEHYAAKAVVTIATALDGNATIPFNYYVCSSETGENVSESCNQMASMMKKNGANQVVHVMDAGPGNRSFVKHHMDKAIVHWCYVHLLKNGASFLDNPKYYPVTTIDYGTLTQVDRHKSLVMFPGDHNMVRLKITKEAPVSQSTIRIRLNNTWQYVVKWKANVNPILLQPSDAGAYISYDKKLPSQFVLTLMRDDLDKFQFATISNCGDSGFNVCFSVSLVQAFSRDTLKWIYNQNPSKYLSLVSIQTVDWTDRQSEGVAADLCKDGFISHIREYPGTDALVKYLDHLQVYNIYNDRTQLKQSDQTTYVPKYNIDQIIAKVSNTINFLEEWHNVMNGVISVCPDRWVTPIYLKSLKENLNCLNNIQQLMMSDPAVKLDPHVLSTNRVEGFFGFLRLFSNTFDTYQFALRFEYVAYELVKALTNNLPFHNRLSRSYKLNQSLTSNSKCLDELATRKPRVERLIEPDVLTRVKESLIKCRGIKHKTIRQQFHIRTTADSNESLMQLSALTTTIPSCVVPRLETVKQPVTFLDTLSPHQMIESVRRPELITFRAERYVTGKFKVDKKDVHFQCCTKVLYKKPFHCQVILHSPLHTSDISHFKLKLVAVRTGDLHRAPLELQMNSVKLDTHVLEFTVVPTTNSHIGKLELQSDAETFDSDFIVVQKSLPQQECVSTQGGQQQSIDLAQHQQQYDSQQRVLFDSVQQPLHSSGQHSHQYDSIQPQNNQFDSSQQQVQFDSPQHQQYDHPSSSQQQDNHSSSSQQQHYRHSSSSEQQYDHSPASQQQQYDHPSSSQQQYNRSSEQPHLPQHYHHNSLLQQRANSLFLSALRRPRPIELRHKSCSNKKQRQAT